MKYLFFNTSKLFILFFMINIVATSLLTACPTVPPKGKGKVKIVSTLQ